MEDRFPESIIRAKQIALVTHTHPDGDAVGSTLALRSFLEENCGKRAVKALYPSPWPDPVDFLFEGIRDKVLVWNEDAGAAARWIAGSDLIICLDFNAFNRTEGMQDALRESPAEKVLIDHHLNPDRESFDLCFSRTEISSASELLFQILLSLPQSGGMARNLPQRCLDALMTGITTDTNNFANSVFPSSFQMASELVAAGVDRDAVVQQIFNNYRENRVRAMGYMQAEGLQILPCGGALMVLTRAIQERFDIREGETEGLVNVPLTIGKVRLSILLKEEGGLFRVSIRSKRGTSAQQLAQRFFHGGGHENAAGGKVLIGEDIPSAGDAPAYVESILKNYLS
jgi:phosphoesterase RecJ-like protein